MPVKENLEMDVTEGVLAIRFKQGDRGAFSVIAHRYMKRAFCLSLGIVGNVEDASDLVHEAFVKAFKKRENLEAGRPFYPWFCAILRNLCLDLINSPQWRGINIDEVPLEMCGSTPDFVEGLEREELKSLVWRAILRLKPAHREIIVLRHFEELSYKELSEVLGISRGTVMSTLYYARSELRKILGPYLKREGWEV